MKIPLTEPTSTRYISATDRVRLFVPFIAGQIISTDNTCKSEVELKAFFEGGAVNELESYKSTLEFHISLLEEGDALRKTKEARLAQINMYLEAIIGMRDNYKNVVNNFLSHPSNLYSIQLRPHTQDPYSRVVNPVFTINRGNDSRGTPLSPLYNKMHEVFPQLILGKSNPREQLITAVSNVVPNVLTKDASLENIQNVLAEQCKVPEDFFKRTLDTRRREQVVDRAYVDRLMGYDEDTTPKEYINALLGLCAPNLQSTLQGSPFYLDTSVNSAEKAERLSMLTQFYLGVMNVYCRAKGISDKNFGAILDASPQLSKDLVEVVTDTLRQGHNVEDAICVFCNTHAGEKEFNLSEALTPKAKETIQQKFEIAYRTVTATKENPHMDDFMFLDTEARGEKDRFITRQGLICTNFANIAPSTGPNQHYFAEIRNEATHHPELITPQNEPVITVDIEPDALMDKLNDVQWEKLPKEIVDACRALPAFKVRQLLDDVAKGKQDEANAILQASDDIQTLLRTPGKFTDYSGRAFHCTAYEYAWWANDTHMRGMLESHMSDETKAELLEKIDEIDRSGLAYQQHGVSYKNPHYDMSFVLKNLSPDEFRQLQTMVGRSNSKIQQATADNYQTIPFTATEYEQLKKALKKHQQWFIPSVFYTSPAKAIGDKLQFDFNSVITNLDFYVNNYDKLNYHQQEEAWMKVGKAQRDVPANVAQEYCRPDRSFDLDAYKDASEPRFKEKTLPRVLTFDNYVTNVKSWFPLTSSSSGLGFDFGLLRAGRGMARGCSAGVRRGWVGGDASFDLAAVRRLYEVRVVDLTLSRENLSQPANQVGLAR